MPKVALVTDPRFPGGTSSAVAAEIRALAEVVPLQVHAVSSAMFQGDAPAPQITDALEQTGIKLIQDAPEISADIVIFHNPSCLKFQERLNTRIIARTLVAVTHENFQRPGGREAFDVARCLDQLSAASLVLTRDLAPVSDWNRRTVTQWLTENATTTPWRLTESNWFNICDFVFHPPSASPGDRRGRHSRPGSEKFPGNDVMQTCFPQHAESNTLLGADSLLHDPATPAYWSVYPFRGLSLPQYFDKIDFMVYFTASTWRESFGRVLAEGIAAGKLVITDPDTAQTFGASVISAGPDEVDGVIRARIKDPELYRNEVRAAQKSLAAYSSDAFCTMFREYARSLGRPVP